MRVRVAMAVDVDPDLLREESDAVAPNATAAEVRAAIRNIAAIQIKEALSTTNQEPTVRLVR
ncbi:hypothetical protein [Mycobacteroides abscessus]|uniref:hypothetical protein n=1 Tax=Mycobacteroides abscessus TaxID=36809 RepID=UPI001041E9C0|nr:hypothetical protein [Mycobacteroides abscessus]